MKWIRGKVSLKSGAIAGVGLLLFFCMCPLLFGVVGRHPQPLALVQEVAPTGTPAPTKASTPTITPTETPTTRSLLHEITPVATSTPTPSVDVGSYPCVPEQIKGNRRSNIYHIPGQRDYRKTRVDVQCFDTEAAAQQAGYRKAGR